MRAGDLVARVVSRQAVAHAERPVLTDRRRDRRWLAAPDLACDVSGGMPHDPRAAQYSHQKYAPLRRPA